MSNFSSSLGKRSVSSNVALWDRPSLSALFLATKRAIADMSVPTALVSLVKLSMLRAMQPEPVQRSKTFMPSSQWRRASSTRNSLSCSGISTSPDTSKVSPINSHCPRIYATGSLFTLLPMNSLKSSSSFCVSSLSE